MPSLDTAFMTRFLWRKRFFRRSWSFTGVLVLGLGLWESGPLWGAEAAILVGAGDIAKCGSRLEGAEATAKLLDQLFSQEGGTQVEAVVFTAGDSAYPRGSAQDFRNCYQPTWGRHKERTRPAVGNHEYKIKGARDYFDYFGKAAGERGKGYYSYDLGDWHIIVLNSSCKKVGGCDEDSPQHRWLVNDLRKHPRPCTAAYWHRPVFSSGKHGGEKAMRPIFQTFYDYGVDVVLNGHEHNYERFAPQDAQGIRDNARGIRQFIVGTGGRELRALKKPKQPNTQVRDNTSYGVLKLTLHSNRYEWEFIPVAGDTFRDSGSNKCH